ncbi:restriction endonuclease subunit S [soil metagenome]
MSSLAEVAEVRLGRQRSPKNHTGLRMRPYLRAANVTWEGLDLSDVKEMNFTEAESAIYEVAPGDVLVAEASGSASEVGKAVIWRGEIDDCCFQNTVIRVRTRGPLPEFLRYYLLSEARSGRIGNASPGVGIHHIGAGRLSAWPVPLPPLNEQRRIVAAIEEQLSRLDAAEASLATAKARARTFHDAALEEAFMNGAPLRTIDDVASLADGPFGSNLKTSHYVAAGPRVVRLQNIGDGLFRDEKAHITQEHFDKLSKHFVVPGDVVVASLGEEAPRACLVPDWLGDAIVKADCIRARPKSDVDAGYLMWALNSRPVKMQAAARIKGIGRPRLGLGGIRVLEIPLPPLEEQRRIVAKVEERLSVIDAMRTSIERAERRSAVLRRSILERAFRGELVPQDPSDEPASVLLDRIHAARSSARPTRR